MYALSFSLNKFVGFPVLKALSCSVAQIVWFHFVLNALFCSVDKLFSFPALYINFTGKSKVFAFSKRKKILFCERN